MVKFTAVLQKFKEQGEKTGWTYIEIPGEIANKIKPGVKKSFRVKGKIDKHVLTGVSLLPMGGGDFIMPVNATIRKSIRKVKGDPVQVEMTEDTKLVTLSTDMLACLEEDKTAKAYFNKLPGSHKNYYSKWIESAKTDATKAKRIAMCLNAFTRGLSFGEMLRENRENNR